MIFFAELLVCEVSTQESSLIDTFKRYVIVSMNNNHSTRYRLQQTRTMLVRRQCVASKYMYGRNHGIKVGGRVKAEPPPRKSCKFVF